MDMEKVEKLIEIVRGHTFLYDVSDQQYKNASLKSAIWESIGRDLDLSGEVARNKWKTVRDGYTKYKKQLKSSTNANRKNVSYTWASQLAFLDDFNGPRGSDTQVLDYLELDTQDMTSKSNSSPLLPTLSSPSSHVPPSSQVPLPEAPAETLAESTSRNSYCNNKRPSNRRDDDDVERLLQLLKAKKKREHDVVDNLFLSYADTFKKFPQRQQVIVKLELAKLFSNIELQLLDNNN